MTWDRGRTTAFHEAGHAVAALHLEIGFSSIAIEETDDSHGNVRGLRSPDSFRSSIGESMTGLALKHAVCAAAGPAAETMLREWEHVATLDDLPGSAMHLVFRTLSSNDDRLIAIEYLKYTGGSESDRAERLKSVAYQALHLLRPDRPLWPAVEALAAALLYRPTITYEDAADIVRRSLGTD